jgi:hypothetical protein
MTETLIPEFISMYLGITFIAISLGIFFNVEYYKSLLHVDLLKNKTVIYVNGYIVLGIGLLLVASHNVWTAGLPVALTIIAWLTLLKGLLILMFPKTYIAIAKGIKMNKTALYGEATLVLIAGLFLIYLSVTI